jgi:hypothetical protein
MSMAEMQACLARLYVDRTFRRLFAIEPEAVLGQYGLSTDESRALRDLDQQALERFARSLKGKRRRRFVATYPLLFGLASPVVDRYYDRYYQLYPARPGGSYVEELQAFGRFIEECLAADDEAPPFASDLARYERLHFTAGRVAAAPRHAEAAAAAADVPQLAPEDRPRLADGVAVGTFRSGILAIVGALKADLPPPEAETGPHTFAFRPGPAGADPTAFYVSEATAELLEWCDGEHSVAEIAAAVDRERSGDGTASAVTGALHALIQHGIVTTAPPGPRASLTDSIPEPWLPDGH